MKENIVDRVRLRVDVSRESDVDDEQGIVSPLLHGAFQVGRRDDVRGGVDRRDNDVDIVDVILERVQEAIGVPDSNPSQS